MGLNPWPSDFDPNPGQLKAPVSAFGCADHHRPSSVLEGHLGSTEGPVEFVGGKADDHEWTRHLSRLSAVAEKVPGDAYAAFTKSLSQDWGYSRPVVPQCGPELLPTKEAITESFLP